ncbi:MAG: hypothetical protein J3K34DRAFT_524737 [Monoraphidium minutum]|nr:MAG: hypothetical protein J3K34DRAFT_524737 [Monoraphidium minutum]
MNIKRWHFQARTSVQPKAFLEECPHASAEGVAAAFSPAACAGIRSLPNALRPGFRELVYAQLVRLGRAAAQQLRSGRAPGAGAARPPPPKGLGGSSLLPGRFSSNRGLFGVCEAEFVVRACPPGHKGVPAFAPFAFDSCPYVETDNLGRLPGRGQQARARGGAGARAPRYGTFVPTGSRAASPAAALKSRTGELLGQLAREVGRDFPASFLQVFQDSRGAVVVSFSRGLAAAEGDVSAYMNRLARSGGTALQFRLCKDAARWGVVEDEGDTAFYALWPPWSPHRPKLPDSLLRLPPPAAARGEAGGGGGGGGEAVLRRAATAARGMGLGIRGLM